MALHATVAPWAEDVPGAPYPMTIVNLLAWPADARWKLELAQGRLVRMPAGDPAAAAIAARLIAALRAFVAPRSLGRVADASTVFNLTPPGERLATGLVPDVAFVRASRLPARKPTDARRAPRLAPDLAVEVTTGRQSRPDLLDKVKVYLAAGVRLVWVVWPAQRRIDVWLPPIPIAGQPTAQLAPGDGLDGSPVLPGFTYPVADLLA